MCKHMQGCSLFTPVVSEWNQDKHCDKRQPRPSTVTSLREGQGLLQHKSPPTMVQLGGLQSLASRSVMECYEPKQELVLWSTPQWFITGGLPPLVLELAEVAKRVLVK